MKNIFSWFKKKNTKPIREFQKSTGLWRRRQNTSAEQSKKGFGHTGEPYWQYECDCCNEDLVPGPSGGGTNQVCENCKINFGCLDGGLER